MRRRRPAGLRLLGRPLVPREELAEDFSLLVRPPRRSRRAPYAPTRAPALLH